MSKKQNKKLAPGTVGGSQQTQDTEKEQSSIRWSFPTVSPCPRCRGTNTQAVSTQKNIQYRICRSAVCRRRYTVRGKKVE